MLKQQTSQLQCKQCSNTGRHVGLTTSNHKESHLESYLCLPLGKFGCGAEEYGKQALDCLKRFPLIYEGVGNCYQDLTSAGHPVYSH